MLTESLGDCVYIKVWKALVYFLVESIQVIPLLLLLLSRFSRVRRTQNFPKATN